MFGKSEWFEKKGILCLWPICWQGWLCVLTGAAVLVLPFLLLLSIEKTPEAFVWLLVVIGFFVWEARQILRPKRSVANTDDVLYIGDDAEPTHIATSNYDLHLRD